MVPARVYRRTARGEAEAAANTLPPKLRRCLALLDGTTSLAELEARFRPGEMDGIVAELHAAGLIELAP